MYHKHNVKEEGCIKSTSSDRDQPGGTKIQRYLKKPNECGWMMQHKSLQLIYFNKRKHPMLVISQLEPRKTKIKWVGGVLWNSSLLPWIVYSRGRPYIFLELHRERLWLCIHCIQCFWQTKIEHKKIRSFQGCGSHF